MLRVGMLLWILVVAEGDGLIAKKGPPLWCWPSAWCGQVARYGGLRDPETEHEKLAHESVEHLRENSQGPSA